MLTGRRLYRRSKQGLPCKLPERQVANLSFPLAFEAVLSDQQYLVDGETDRHVAAHLENTRHGIACPYPLVGVSGHGRYKSSVLYADDVNFRVTTLNAPHDFEVEVLVSGQPEQRRNLVRRASK
jgi:hypothetical protein